MVEIMDRDTIAAVNGSQAGTFDRRRPGRLANPSPELIALMRKPSNEAMRKLALYDAPSFEVPQPLAATRIDVAHFGRVVTAIIGCAGAWGGSIALMLHIWG